MSTRIKSTMTIWKYKLSTAAVQKILIPSEFKILDIQDQNGFFHLWALVNKESKTKWITIKLYGTGEILPFGINNQVHLKTVKDEDYIWHYFLEPND